MEELFQILFILIFILSSIASSMKKKKKRAKAQQARSKPVSKPQQIATKKQKSSSELLEEMLGLKIELPEPQRKGAPINYSEDSIKENSTWDPSKDYADSLEYSAPQEDGTSNYQDKTEAKKSEFIKARQKHKAFKETVVESEKSPQQKRIAKLFSTSTNLKDYILIQEILNKPKALRR